ncbi:MAG: tRNA epoxyqueuosine(34) reductase QueG [Oscillospiraceae bacterium]|nr:tRNA epoxyqueuosine(34) reductase QueG [Oscillospiraceae bacterium]
MDIKYALSSYLNSLNLNCFGFLSFRNFEELRKLLKFKIENNLMTGFEKGEIHERIDPKKIFPYGETIISIAFPYFYEDTDYSKLYFSKYCQSMDYHVIVKGYLNKICAFLKDNFHCEAIGLVDNNILCERHIASLAGIGFIGKNNMLITKQYGSFVFLGEIVTSLKIMEDSPMKSLCGTCLNCIKACPTNSLGGNDPSICLSNLTQSKELNEKWYKFFNNRLWGCDTCQDVCPYNKDIPRGILPEFKPLDHLSLINIDEINNMSNKVFKDKYKISACGYRGKKYLIRNLKINIL